MHRRLVGWRVAQGPPILECSSHDGRCGRISLSATTFPAALDDLISQYLPAVPMDPFDDRLLRYVRDAGLYTLYSVGDNLVDDGGDADPEPETGLPKDLVEVGPMGPPRWKRMLVAAAPWVRAQAGEAIDLLQQWRDALQANARDDTIR